MSELTVTDNPAARRRKWLRWGASSAVVFVPLAFAGLFVGALGQTDTALETIPAAIVNEDSLITTTAADGTEQNVFAGRQLVTELTGDGATGFDWTITNAEDAEEQLANGEVYAILTVPSNFSKSILSLSTDSPEQADITIRTDDAHSYLTGSVAQVVGQSMVDTFGNAITAQYIGGIYASLGDIGTALATASDGASQLADGATDFSSGLGQYTGGVNSLSSGLSELNSGASGLSSLSAGVSQYTDGVSQLAATLAAINPAIQANATVDPVVRGTLQAVVDGLGSAAGSGTVLSQQTSSAIAGIQGGISQSATGAAQLAAGSGALTSGADSIASGASELASGLAEGAGQVPSLDDAQSAATAEVIADPVGLSIDTDNAVTDIGQAVATFFVPLGLWIGALAVFLVMRPVTRRALDSTARNGRLVFSTLSRALLITGAQALLLVAMLHLALGVAWSLLPATLAFALVMAFAFTAFHHVLTIAFGRAGLVVSLFLLAIQVTSTGGLYPIELLATPFQAVSPVLPLTYAVDGMQGIIAGADAGGVVVAGLVLLGFGTLSTLVALAAVRRSRRATALGLTARPA